MSTTTLSYFIGDPEKAQSHTLHPIYFHFGAYAERRYSLNPRVKVGIATAGGASQIFEFRAMADFAQTVDIDLAYRATGMTNVGEIGWLQLVVESDNPDFYMYYDFHIRTVNSVAYHSQPLLGKDESEGTIVPSSPLNFLYFEATFTGVMSRIGCGTSGGIVEKELVLPKDEEVGFGAGNYDNVIKMDNPVEEKPEALAPQGGMTGQLFDNLHV